MSGDMEGGARALLIMAVDDEPNILSALRRCLHPLGAQFAGFDAPAKALAALSSREPDLIISDMRMPDMDGAAFLAAAKGICPGALRILLTGYSDYERAMSAVNDGGIWRHLSKPWKDDELRACVKQALDMRTMTKERRRLEELSKAQSAQLAALNKSLEAKVQERTAMLGQANAKLDRNFSTLVKVLASIADRRIPGAGGRCAEIARRACAQLNLPKAECDLIERAARLRLIGAMGLSDEMLATPPEELAGKSLALWRAAPIHAEELLMPLEDLRPEAALIRAQSERFDGAGYPDGLEGSAIPLGARVLAASAAFDRLMGASSLDDPAAARAAGAELMRRSWKELCPKSCEAVLAAMCVAVDPKAAQGSAPAPSKAHQVGVRGLREGMALDRDAIAPNGVLLLSAGHRLSEALIEQLRKFEDRHGFDLKFWIAPEGASAG